MFDWQEFHAKRDLLQEMLGPAYYCDHDLHLVQITVTELPQIVKVLRDDLGFFFISDLSVIGLGTDSTSRLLVPQASWDITYHLLNLEAHQRLELHVSLTETDELPIEAHWHPATQFLMQNQGLRFLSAPAKVAPLSMPKIKGNPNLSESPYQHELNQWYLFDVNHRLTEKQWALLVESYGGTVKSAQLQCGYWGRQLELKARSMSLQEVQRHVSPLVASAVPLTGIAWVKTVEDYFKWRIPERAQAIRMLAIELSRLSHHFHVLAKIARALGIDEGKRVCSEATERIRQLWFTYTGSRIIVTAACFGGLEKDIPAGWMVDVKAFLQSADFALKWYQRVVGMHPLAKRRLKTAALSSQAALVAGITGPVLRATGINFDLRKAQPFYFYGDIDFEVPVGLNGESHDRLLVLLEECFQSLRILWQVVENLPLGAVMMEHEGVAELNRGELDPQVWQHWCKEANRMTGTRYSALEGVNGELAFHAVFDRQKPQLSSLKIKTNACFLAEALPLLLQSCPLSELSSALATIDIEASCTDK